MKKILKAMALVVCLVLPLSAMAMTAIGDNELSSVTGQSGVSINMDVTMDMSVATIAWGDCDGVNNGVANISSASGGASEGWVGLSNLHINTVRVRLRHSGWPMWR
jgi:hypothetical protein